MRNTVALSVDAAFDTEALSDSLCDKKEYHCELNQGEILSFRSHLHSTDDEK